MLEYNKQDLPIPFRMVKEGRGGTFGFHLPTPSDHASEVAEKKFSHDRASILRIGTYACRTCVGFYYKIDDERCFFAHIDAFVTDPESDAIPPEDRLISDAEGKDLQARVLAALKEEAYRYSWSWIPLAGHKAVACCPQLVLGGRKLAGQYVLAAIREFLGDLSLEMLDDADGFIVEHQKDTIDHVFQYDKTAIVGHPPRAVGLGYYVPRDQQGDKWTFEIVRVTDKRRMSV